MKFTGTSELKAPVDQVWTALLDPAVLARCIPGCEALSATGPDQYEMTVTAGVAAIKGTYKGAIALTDKDEPHSLKMKASGAGGPGTIDADVLVSMAPSATGGTTLTFDADASVGGAIGGVGQRMLAGVTKKMAGAFFTSLDRDIAGYRPEAVVVGAPGAPGAPVPAGAGAPAGGAPVIYGAPSAADTGARIKDFALGAAAGGGLVLLGVLVGWAIGRR